MSSDFSIDMWMDELVDEVRTKGVARESMPSSSARPSEHFNMSANPFADSVNPDFFYRTEGHEEALIALKQCIEQDISIGLVTAVSGTGKTLVSQVLLSEIASRSTQVILLLAHPGMTRTSLLREILEELGYEEIPHGTGVDEMVNVIQQHIIDQFLKGIKIVIMIDEVHFLQSYALQVLRTLSNIEVPERKLVTLLLFGERSFLSRMNHPSYRSIFSRMFTRIEIQALDAEEVRQYVKYRLMVAGADPEIFSPESFALIHRRSRGIPREINRICHNAMMIAARLDQRRVSAEVVSEVPAALDLSEG